MTVAHRPRGFAIVYVRMRIARKALDPMHERLRNKKPGFATRAIHQAQEANEFLGALTPPVFMTSTYGFTTVEEGEAIFRGDAQGYVYGRTRNPTQALFEARIASLGGAETGLALASGMAAISATMFSLLEAGDRVLFNNMLYGNSFELFARGLPRLGIESMVVDFTDLDEVAKMLEHRRPKLIFFETPSNPALTVVDISAIAALAKQAGALTVVDNTFATPLLQRPLELGADLVIHSATKYLGGHGDLIAGAVAGPGRLIDEIRRKGLRNLTGATIAPMTAFLLLRGLKTLELRMDRHCSSALAIAQGLQSHPAVSWVSYPGLEGSRFYEVAQRQMSAFGGLIACELHGGKRAGVEFMNRLKLARLAVSLGDAETLVQHPASMTHATYTPEERVQHGISDGLIRFSIGLESLADIQEDIFAALAGG
jgi:methionine-gamma-lyase